MRRSSLCERRRRRRVQSAIPSRFAPSCSICVCRLTMANRGVGGEAEHVCHPETAPVASGASQNIAIRASDSEQ